MKAATEFNLAHIIAGLVASPAVVGEISSEEGGGKQFAAVFDAAVGAKALRQSGIATLAESGKQPLLPTSNLPDSEPLELELPDAVEATALPVTASTLPAHEPAMLTTISFLTGRQVLVLPVDLTNSPAAELPEWWQEQRAPAPAQSLSGAMALTHARLPEPQLYRQLLADAAHTGREMRSATPLAATTEAAGVISRRIAGQTMPKTTNAQQAMLQTTEAMQPEAAGVAVQVAAAAMVTDSQQSGVAAPLQHSVPDTIPGAPSSVASTPALVPAPRVATVPSPAVRSAAPGELPSEQPVMPELEPAGAVAVLEQLADAAVVKPQMNGQQVTAQQVAPQQVMPQQVIPSRVNPSQEASQQIIAQQMPPQQEAPKQSTPRQVTLLQAPALAAELQSQPLAATVMPIQVAQADTREPSPKRTAPRADAVLSRETAALTTEPVLTVTATAPDTAAVAQPQGLRERVTASVNQEVTSRVPPSDLTETVAEPKPGAPEPVTVTGADSLAGRPTAAIAGTYITPGSQASAAPPGTEPAVAPPRALYRPEFAESLLGFAAAELDLPQEGGVSRLRLEISPPEFGHLDIEVTQGPDSLDVKILTADASAAAALRESEHVMRELLMRNDGTRVTIGIDVGTGNGNAGGRQDQQDRQGNDKPAKEADSRLVKVRVRDNNQFDIYV